LATVALAVLVLAPLGTCFAWGTGISAFITTEELAHRLRLRHHLERRDSRAVLTDDTNKVVVYPGRYSAVVNGDIVVMESVARMERGKLMVPRSFLNKAEAGLRRTASARRPTQWTPRARPRVRVVIDPGHGGKDPGASRGSAREKDIVLDVGKRVTMLLKQRGMQAIMTRTRDVFVTLSGRAAVSNRYGADVFVSIHVNSTPGATTASGVEVFCVSPKYNPIRRGYAAAGGFDLRGSLKGAHMPASTTHRRLLCAALFEDYVRQSRDLSYELLRALTRATGAKSRNVKNDQNLHVTRETQCARALVEIGFVSNSWERKKLMRSSYRQRVAEGIAEGIERFVRKRERWAQ